MFYSNFLNRKAGKVQFPGYWKTLTSRMTIKCPNLSLRIVYLLVKRSLVSDFQRFPSAITDLNIFSVGVFTSVSVIKLIFEKKKLKQANCGMSSFWGFSANQPTNQPVTTYHQAAHMLVFRAITPRRENIIRNAAVT